MLCQRPVLTAVLVLLYLPALAGQAPAPEGPLAPPPAVDVSWLPVNIGRIGRQLRQVQVREERDGLKLRYTVNVYGDLPKVRLITPLDNILTGDVSHTAPTSADMVRMMTPKEFSAPIISLGAVPRRK